MSETGESTAASQETAPAAPGGVRHIVESLVCLAIAVMLFRAFEIEGYIISTGSMAPSLLGYHKRVACPVCKFPFAHGVAYDDVLRDHSPLTLRSEADAPPRSASSLAVCPNCSQAAIDVSDIPRNEGDQLLVYKNAFSLQTPERWEVVVFRNPTRPTQAYVKRIVGLPGEDIQILGGDVYANGDIQRKDLERQRAIRIPVYDYDYHPQNDATWRPRWLASPGWMSAANRFEFSPPDVSAEAALSWLTYRHWIRSGGTHETSVPLESWPEDVQMPSGVFIPLTYDAEKRQLTCSGALSRELRDRLLVQTDDPDFVRTIRRIYDESHVIPVSDLYGYNRHAGTASHVGVSDLMIQAQVTIGAGEGRLVVQMDDGRHVVQTVFDPSSQELRLHVDGSETPARSVPWPAEQRDRPFHLEMSTFDRQVLVAIDGQPAFAPWCEADAPLPQAAAPRHPVRFGAAGLAVRLDSLALYRDVYYTRGGGRNGVDAPYRLDQDEYFVLGDNSPVSLDSRSWPDAAVHRNLLLGKPFLVHLPSRPGRIRLGDYVGHIRIPDISRIRYIR